MRACSSYSLYVRHSTSLYSKLDTVYNMVTLTPGCPVNTIHKHIRHAMILLLGKDFAPMPITTVLGGTSFCVHVTNRLLPSIP